jgi:hypothetical protein
MGREILTQKELRKGRNSLCVGGFLKRIDVAKDPAQAQGELAVLEQAVLEAHEYLNALKAGELYESAAFAEQFAQYKAHYTFPEEN